MNIIGTIFNLRYLCHFCMDFNATKYLPANPYPIFIGFIVIEVLMKNCHLSKNLLCCFPFNRC